MTKERLEELKQRHYGIHVPPEYEHLFDPKEKVIVKVAPRYFGLFETIREGNKFINYYKKINTSQIRGFIKGKNNG